MTEKNFENRIDLPPPPKLTTSAKEVLLDASMIAYTRDHRRLAGKLKSLRYAEEIVVIQPEFENEPSSIEFSDLLYLFFMEELPIAKEGDVPFREHGALKMPPPFQKFKVQVSNDETISGRMKGHFIDNYGLHIFKLVDTNSVVRFFFPSNSIKQHSTGNPLGETLVKQKKASTRDVVSALERQEKLRKQKLGEHLEEEPVIEPEQLERALKQQATEDSETGGDESSHHKIGELLVGKERITPEQLDKALKLQSKQQQEKIGEFLVEEKVVEPEQVEEALKQQKKQRQAPFKGKPPKRLGEILIDEEHITLQQLERALASQSESKDKKIGAHLVEMGVVNQKDVNRALAREIGIPYVNLDEFEIENQALATLPHDIAQKYRVIPLRLYEDHLLIAFEDPLNKEAIDVTQFVTNMHLELVTASGQDIESAIRKYYSDVKLSSDIVEAELLHQSLDIDEEQAEELSEAERLSRDKPVVRLVSKFIIDAINQRASDIHIRPGEDSVDILFRIDGTLVKMRSFNKSLLNAVVSRIKVIGKMDISERRLPQDGATKIIDGNKHVDLRISIIPTVNGESAVIRLLNTETGIMSIAELGFTPHDSEVFRSMLHKSYGLVLVTGPTGSGKSTTLYAALKEIISRNVNIITVEDPVEYHISDIEQIQVNTVPGYTFARALRHILRHDPDAIMIGEIRDEETGKIAIESALTGHLVLSTLHTNDASGTVARLLEMGIDPFLLNGTVLGVFAQRLVRKNCQNCIDKEPYDELARKVLDVPEPEIFYKGRGCKKCNHTGYKGRMAAYELLTITAAMREIIRVGVSVDEIHAQAIKDGMVPLTQNALQLARDKKISLAEVYRVRLE